MLCLDGTDGGGQLLITALGAAGSVVSSTTFKISGDLTAKGVVGAGVDGIVLDDISGANGGIALLQFDGAAAQAVSTGEIDGSGAKEGSIVVTGTGTSVTLTADKIGD